MSVSTLGRSALVGAIVVGLFAGTGCSQRSVRSLAEPPPRIEFAGVLQDVVELGAAEILAFDPGGILGPAVFVTTTDGVARINLGHHDDALAVRSVVVFPLGLAPGEEVTSVAVDPAGRGFGAVAVLPEDPQAATGRAVLFELRTGDILTEVNTGFHPDCVVFSPDGRWLVTANEGEGVGPADRPGGITLVDLTPVTAQSFPRALESRTITLFDEPGLEPEYLAADNAGVWVAFQESSELWRHDFGSGDAWSVRTSLGPRMVWLDADDRDGVISPTDHVLALPQPDTLIRVSTPRGDRLIAANEGDPREGEGVRFATVDADSAMPRLEVGAPLNDPSRFAAFGTRDISILDPETGSLLATTGTQIEYAAKDLALARIARGETEAEADLDKRSDKRGPEPEGLAAISFAGRSLVFVGLERADGVVIFDVSNPAEPERVGLIDLQDAAIRGDAPEGLIAFALDDSAYLAVASEASGTVHFYRLTQHTR